MKMPMQIERWRQRVRKSLRTRDRIYIRPTLLGLLSSLVLCGGVFGVVIFGHMGLLGFAAMVILGLVTGLIQTNSNLKNIEATRVGEAPAVAHRPISMVIEVKIRGRGSRFRLRLETDDMEGTTLEQLDASTPQQVILRCAPHTRGVYQVPPIAVSSRFPLGIAVAWRYLQPRGELVIYPEPNSQASLPSTVTNRPIDKTNPTMSHDAGSDFLGHRTPTPGDPPGHMDWKLLARKRGRWVKAFATEMPNLAILRLDQAPGSTFEDRLATLSKWAQDLTHLDQPFGLDLGRSRVYPGGGRQHLWNVQRALAAAKPVIKPSLETVDP